MKLSQLKEILMYLVIVVVILLLGGTILAAKFKLIDSYPLLSVIMIYASYAFVGLALGLIFSKDYIAHLWKNRGQKKTAQWGYITICAVLILLFAFEFTRIPSLFVLLKLSQLNISRVINPYVLDFLLLGFFLPRTLSVANGDDK